MRASLMAAIVLAMLLADAPVSAQRQRAGAREDSVAVDVVEVAGGRAFLSAGENEGVRAGSVVRFRSARLRVLAATRTRSVVDLGDEHLREGDHGQATVTPEEDAGSARRLPAPAPLSRHRGMWPNAVRPATLQHPRHVAIGRIGPTGPVRVVLSESSAAAVPFGQPSDAVAWTELRARADGTATRAVGFDADAAVRLWLARGLLRQAGPDRRPLILVRAAEGRIGPRGAPILAFGRLRSAAATVGMLDGVRVGTPPLGGVSLAAFGGAVPDPVTTEPALQATRFGVELAARDRKSALRPSLAIVGMGSTFEGELDERRVAMLGRLFPGPLMLGGGLELSQFPADNPWGAPAVELTSASLDASAHAGVFHAGARFDLWRPQRSRWLDAVLPLGLACTVAAAESTCESPGEAVLSGALDLGLDLPATSVRAGGSVATGSDDQELQELSGWLFARRTGLFGFARAELGATATRTAFADFYSLRPGVGASVSDGTLDIGLYWRPLLYRAFLDAAWRVDHRGGFELVASPSPSVDLTLAGEIGAGYDRDSFTLMSTAAWRPLP